MSSTREYKCHICYTEFSNDVDQGTHLLFTHNFLNPTCGTDVATKQYRVSEYLRSLLERFNDHGFIRYIILKKLIDIGAVDLPAFYKTVRTYKYIEAKEKLDKIYGKHWKCDNVKGHFLNENLRHEWEIKECIYCKTKRPAKYDDIIKELTEIVENPKKYTTLVKKSLLELDEEYALNRQRENARLGKMSWDAQFDYEISIIMNDNEEHKKYVKSLCDAEFEISEMDRELNASEKYRKHNEELKSIQTMSDEEEKEILEKAKSIPYNMIIRHDGIKHKVKGDTTS